MKFGLIALVCACVVVSPGEAFISIITRAGSAIGRTAVKGGSAAVRGGVRGTTNIARKVPGAIQRGANTLIGKGQFSRGFTAGTVVSIAADVGITEITKALQGNPPLSATLTIQAEYELNDCNKTAGSPIFEIADFITQLIENSCPQDCKVGGTDPLIVCQDGRLTVQWFTETVLLENESDRIQNVRDSVENQLAAITSQQLQMVLISNIPPIVPPKSQPGDKSILKAVFCTFDEETETINCA